MCLISHLEVFGEAFVVVLPVDCLGLLVAVAALYTTVDNHDGRTKS